MLDALMKNALRDIWCSPHQDRQVVIKLSRHSPLGGVRRHYEVQWELEKLPTEKDFYHVYGIGRNTPRRLNFDAIIGPWISFKNLCEQNDLIADFYTDTGIMIPRTMVFVKRTINKSFIVAIRMDNRFLRLDDAVIYMRLYSNAFYQSQRFTGTRKIENNSIRVENVSDALPLQWEYHQRLALPTGKAYAFINGVYVDDFRPSDIRSGDYVEWFYDASIKQVYDFKLDELKTFLSVLDQQQKYLVHPPKNLGTIDFFDDCDFFIIEKKSGRVRGRYYHRNNEKAVRQLTHNDYALSVLILQAYIDRVGGWLDTSDLYVRIHIRNSGYDRPLSDEHLRIKELYKLNDDQITRAMLGLDSTIPEWRAAHLENSNYTRIMRSFYNQISPNMVVDAYGYNAMVKLLADTPQRNAGGFVDLSPALIDDSTIYEYNAQGRLLGFYRNQNRERYLVVNPSCAFIEGIVGYGNSDSGIVYGIDNVPISEQEEYRFYVCSLNIAGQRLNNWQDVTGDASKYRITNGVVEWLIDPTGQIGAVKGTARFTSYTLTLAEYDHLYRFSLNNSTVPGDVLYIPPGSLDIWLNGHPLIENVDYYVNYPEVVIVNKRYLVDGSQTLTIRGYGFCAQDLTREHPTDIGYVLHDTISLNNTYNIRDDKVVRCVVGGKVVLRDDLQFAENAQMVDVPAGLNGLPYAIYDIPQPIRGILPYVNFVLRDRSRLMDKKVSDYLSSRLPEPEFEASPWIPEHYNVYSPYMAKILYDLWAGLIVPLTPGTSDQRVLEYLAPYQYLLQYDPMLKPDTDFRFIRVHVHPKNEVLDVTQAIYSFLSRINRLVFAGRFELSHSLRIEVGE